jgi:hypothetical protein
MGARKRTDAEAAVKIAEALRENIEVIARHSVHPNAHSYHAVCDAKRLATRRIALLQAWMLGCESDLKTD